MIMHAVQTGTPFVYEIFRISYCIRSNCTSDKYFLFKWCNALFIISEAVLFQSSSCTFPEFIMYFSRVHHVLFQSSSYAFPEFIMYFSRVHHMLFQSSSYTFPEFIMYFSSFHKLYFSRVHHVLFQSSSCTFLELLILSFSRIHPVFFCSYLEFILYFYRIHSVLF